MVRKKKGEVKVTPVSGNVVAVGVVVIILVALYLVFGDGIELPTGPSGPSGLSAENPIKTESDVGAAMTDVGTDIQGLTSVLKDLDDKIA